MCRVGVYRVRRVGVNRVHGVGVHRVRRAEVVGKISGFYVN